MEYHVGRTPMKDYTAPTVETYGSVEELSESMNDGGYGRGPPDHSNGNDPN
jgi:hypothetical protein